MAQALLPVRRCGAATHSTFGSHHHIALDDRKTSAPSFVGRGFNRDKTPHRKTKGLQPLLLSCHFHSAFFPITITRHASLATHHSSLITHHSSLSSTHPVNFYCGHYGSSPRKTKGNRKTNAGNHFWFEFHFALV